MSAPRPRVAILGFFHEANTFASPPIDDSAVAAATLRGSDIVTEHLEASTVLSGYLAAARDLDVDLVPLTYTELTPSGPLTASAFDLVRTDLIGAVTRAGPWDALLVCLHGAAVAEGVTDVDGALLHSLGAAVGPDTRIAVTLDLHANITRRMVAASDVLLGYRTNPHLDPRERAYEATELTIRTVRGEVTPTTANVAVPIALNILDQGTSSGPMADLMAELAGVLAEPGVLTASLFEGFPYADVPDIGMHAVVTTDGDFHLARHHARRLARIIWAARERFTSRGPTAAEAIAAVPDTGTALLLDVGDNIGGGAPGDSTEILRTAVARRLDSLIMVLRAPDAVTACAEAGVGATVTLAVGADRVPVVATVLRLADGKYEDTGPTHVGHRYFDAGQEAIIRLADGPTVLLCSLAVMPSSTQQLRAVGIEPRDYRAVVAKGVHSPMASYGAIADTVLAVETSGVTAARLDTLAYQHRPRPLFPFDEFDHDPIEDIHP